MKLSPFFFFPSFPFSLSFVSPSFSLFFFFFFLFLLLGRNPVESSSLFFYFLFVCFVSTSLLWQRDLEWIRCNKLGLLGPDVVISLEGGFQAGSIG